MLKIFYSNSFKCWRLSAEGDVSLASKILNDSYKKENYFKTMEEAGEFCRLINGLL